MDVNRQTLVPKILLKIIFSICSFLFVSFPIQIKKTWLLRTIRIILFILFFPLFRIIEYFLFTNFISIFHSKGVFFNIWMHHIKSYFIVPSMSLVTMKSYWMKQILLFVCFVWLNIVYLSSLKFDKGIILKYWVFFWKIFDSASIIEKSKET